MSERCRDCAAVLTADNVWEPGSPCPKCGHQPDTPNHVHGCTANVLPFPCPTCRGPVRETVGMVCQTCGTDYAQIARKPRPGATSQETPPTEAVNHAH